MRSIERAQEGDKVFVDEDPSLSRFRAWELTHASATPHFLRVHLEKLGCLCEIEGNHSIHPSGFLTAGCLTLRGIPGRVSLAMTFSAEPSTWPMRLMSAPT